MQTWTVKVQDVFLVLYWWLLVSWAYYMLHQILFHRSICLHQWLTCQFLLYILITFLRGYQLLDKPHWQSMSFPSKSVFSEIWNLVKMVELIPETTVRQFQDNFNRLADRDGHLPTRLLGNLLRSVGENPTKEELQDFINLIDKEASGVIKFPDFLFMMASKVTQTIQSDIKMTL